MEIDNNKSDELEALIHVSQFCLFVVVVKCKKTTTLSLTQFQPTTVVYFSICLRQNRMADRSNVTHVRSDFDSDRR